MIGRHGSAYGPQHEITGQQKKEVTEGQQKSRPFAPLDID